MDFPTLRSGLTSDRRDSNRQLNTAEFERGATVLKSRPRVLFVELTENCNLSCPMCRSAAKFDKAKNMSRELFERVASELFETAEIVDLRGWGESTILRDFPEYVDRTLAYGCRLRIVTNLTVPNEELWRKLMRHKALIAVSLDAAEQSTLSVLRRGAKLDVILRNLEILADEGRACGTGTDNVHLNVVVQPAALGELREIVRLAGRLGFRVHLNPLSAGQDDPDNLRFHRQELATALREAAELAETENVEVRLAAALDESWALPQHAAHTCTHPWMYCYVNHQGMVGFCDHLIGEPGDRYLLGDLRTHSFEEIWNGDAYRQLRAEHVRWEQGISERFEECNWCYRNRYTDFEQETYPPYESHAVPLTPGSCPVTGLIPTHTPASVPRRLLPVVDATTRSSTCGS